MSKWIAALSVKKYDDAPLLKVGSKIKIYGRKTEITGFEFHYNDSLEKWETILLTTGRGDPLERSLDVIEVLMDE